MRTKDKILVATVALMILTWLFPPMSESPRFYYRNREAPKKFDGFHFILSNDPYSKTRVLTLDWSKLLMLNLVTLGAGGVCYFVISKNAGV